MQYLSIVLMFVLMVIGGCGSSAGDSNSNTPPTISDFIYSPSTASQNEGGGSITVSGKFNFFDVDGDIERLVTIYNGEIFYMNPEAGGLNSGEIYLTGSFRTDIIGIQSVTIYLKDSRGNESNRLTGTFTVQ